MAKPPRLRQVSASSLGTGQPPWFGRFLNQFNEFARDTTTALSQGLTFDENSAATLKTVVFKTTDNYWNSSGLGDYDQVLLGKVSGYSALAGGALTTINTPAVSATSEIMLCRRTLGTAPGVLTYGNVVAGTSFDILSSNAADDGEATWQIINPAAPEFPKVEFQSELRTLATGVVLLALNPSDSATLLLPTHVSWSEPVNGIISIDFIAGLKANTTYAATFLVF